MADEPKPRKKAVNGKAKGSGFENTIAKLLSETFKPLEFRRSQSSGAILGGKNHVLLHKFSEDAKALFVGDVVPTNEADVFKVEGWKFRFTIECKFYKDADTFSSLFKSPQVTGWFEQAYTDASKVADKTPLLIFKFNHTPVFGAVEKIDEDYQQCDTLPYSTRNVIELKYPIADDLCRTICIFPLADVLSTPEWFKTYYKDTDERKEGEEAPQAPQEHR